MPNAESRKSKNKSKKKLNKPTLRPKSTTSHADMYTHRNVKKKKQSVKTYLLVDYYPLEISIPVTLLSTDKTGAEL